MMFAFRPLVKIAAIGGCSLSLMHCSTVADNVKVADSNTPSYSLSFAHKTSPDSRWAIAGDLQSTQGTGTQVFPEEVQYSQGNQTAVRPEITTRDDFRLTAASLSARWTLLDQQHLKMNIYFGGTQVNADVDIRDGNGGKWHLSRDTFAFTPKFELIYPINEKLSLVASTTDMLQRETSYSSELIALNFHLNETIALSLGYKRWTYDDDPDTSSALVYPTNQLSFDRTSELEIRSKGVMGGIAFNF